MPCGTENRAIPAVQKLESCCMLIDSIRYEACHVRLQLQKGSTCVGKLGRKERFRAFLGREGREQEESVRDLLGVILIGGTTI